MRKSERVSAIVLGVAMLIGIAFRLHMYLLDRSLWYDAAALANSVVSYSYEELFGPLLFNQSAPVGFLVLSKFIGSIFGYSELALTFLPLVFGIAALLLFLVLSVEMLGVVAAPLAFVPFAFCSSAVYYSGEFKQYSDDLFFSVLILFVADRVLKHDHATKWLIVFGAVGMVSVWFSLASIIVVAGTGLAIYLYADDKKPVRIVGEVILLHFAVLYFLQIRPATPIFMFDYWAEYFAQWSPSWWWSTITGYAAFPLGFQGVAVLAMLAFAYGLKSNRAVLLAFPFVVLVVLSILHLYPIATGQNVLVSRLLLFSIPMAFILIAAGITEFSKLFSRPLPIMAVLGLLLAYGSLSSMIPFPVTARQEMKPLVASLNKQLSDGDSIYVYRRAVPAFTFYTRDNPVPFYSGSAIMPMFLPRDMNKFFSTKRSHVWVVATQPEQETLKIIRRELESQNNHVQVQQWPGVWLFEAVPNEPYAQ